MQNGLVHIYCGDGKGKTTAATGLALRCLGRGGRVLFFQFLKSADTGEVAMFEKLDNVTVKKACENVKFFCDMSEEEKAATRKLYCDALKEVLALAPEYDMLVLDEVFCALETDCCEYDVLYEFLMNKPPQLEVIMTGRNPADTLIERADYVSRIDKVKHPFDRGVGARKMIEF